MACCGEKGTEVNSLGKALPAEASVFYRHCNMDQQIIHLRFDLGHVVGTSPGRNESQKVQVEKHGQSVGIGEMSKSIHEFPASLSRNLEIFLHRSPVSFLPMSMFLTE